MFTITITCLARYKYFEKKNDFYFEKLIKCQHWQHCIKKYMFFVDSLNDFFKKIPKFKNVYM